MVHMQFARAEKSCSDKEYIELMKLNKKHAILEIKKDKYSDADRRMYEKGMSPNSRAMFREHDKPFTKYRAIFKDLANKALQLRNEILHAQKGLDTELELDWNKLKPKEFGKLIESSKMVENDKAYSIFSVFDI